MEIRVALWYITILPPVSLQIVTYLGRPIPESARVIWPMGTMTAQVRQFETNFMIMTYFGKFLPSFTLMFYPLHVLLFIEEEMEMEEERLALRKHLRQRITTGRYGTTPKQPYHLAKSQMRYVPSRMIADCNRNTWLYTCIFWWIDYLVMLENNQRMMKGSLVLEIDDYIE